MNVGQKTHGTNKSIDIKTLRAMFWSQFQGFPFKANILIFSAVVLSTVLLISSLNQPILKILFALTLSLALGLVVIPFLESVISLPRKIKGFISVYGATKYYSNELKEEFSSLSNLMKVKTRNKDPIGVVAKWINAAAKLDKSIVLGQPIVEEFEKDERMGVLAHELAHCKGNHSVICAGLLMPFIVVLLYSLSILQLPWYIEVLIIFSFFGLAMPITSWPFEYKADAVAARYIGKEKMIAALNKLAEANSIDINQDSYSHPAISRRVAHLRKLV